MLEIVLKPNDVQAALEMRMAWPLEEGFPTAGSNQRKLPTMGKKILTMGESENKTGTEGPNAHTKTLVPIDTSFLSLTSIE